MEQLDQFPGAIQESGQNKFKIISIVLATVVLVLAGALIFSLMQKTKALPQLNSNSAQQPVVVGDKKEETKTPEIVKSASVDEKKNMGLPDVSNIEIVSRDDKGLPIAYKILKGPNFIDSDDDSLTDADEAKFGTDKDSPDTDDDGISDWQELSQGTDPKVKNDFNTKK